MKDVDEEVWCRALYVVYLSICTLSIGQKERKASILPREGLLGIWTDCIVNFAIIS